MHAHRPVFDSAKLPSIIDLWSEQAGVTAEEMAVNFVAVDQQQGRGYKIMANHYLPSIWSSSSVSSLQLGLAKAPALYFDKPWAEVMVITTMIESGLVVEAGEIQHWSAH